MISPCQCTGSIRYVHVKCLAEWRGMSPLAAVRCPQCNYMYKHELLYAGIRRVVAVSILMLSYIPMGLIPIGMVVMAQMCLHILGTLYLAMRDSSTEPFFELVHTTSAVQLLLATSPVLTTMLPRLAHFGYEYLMDFNAAVLPYKPTQVRTSVGVLIRS